MVASQPEPAAFVVLQHVPILSRQPHLSVGPEYLEICLPGLFGRNRVWRLTRREVAVVDRRFGERAAARAAGHSRGAPATLLSPLVLPYLPTTSRLLRPNLELLFRRQEVTPPLRPLAAFLRRVPILAPGEHVGGGVGRSVESRLDRARASDTSLVVGGLRRPPTTLTGGFVPKGSVAVGRPVDGVRLRVADPAQAVHDLVAAGVELAMSREDWQAAHRPTTNDPATMRGLRRRRRWRVIAAAAVPVGWSAFELVDAANRGRWAIPAACVVLTAVVAGRIRSRRRSRR